jgi:hypothetical protein
MVINSSIVYTMATPVAKHDIHDLKELESIDVLRKICKNELGNCGISFFKDILEKLLNDHSSIVQYMFSSMVNNRIISQSSIYSKRDMLDIIPEDLMSYLLIFLNVITVECSLSRLNKKWNEFVNRPKVTKIRKVIDIDYKKNVTDDVLGYLSKKYTQVNRLDLSSCTQITDSGLCTMEFKNLTYVSLYRCDKINDVSVIIITKMNKNLKYINVDCCTVTKYSTITTKSITSIVNNCKEIEEVILDSAKSVTDIQINILVSQCNKLHTLGLKWCKLLTDNCLKYISKHCKERLHTIDLHKNINLTSEGLNEFIETCKNLKIIRLMKLNISFDVLRTLSKNTELTDLNLKTFRLINCKLTNNVIAQIQILLPECNVIS